MNILILSVGTRNKIVQYFRKSVAGKGKIIATDMSELAPALYEADKYYIVPKMTASNYLEVILKICKDESIIGILSLIDPELSLLAKNKDVFRSIGVTVVGSEYELCEMSLDKYQMYEWLKSHNYNCAKSYVDKQLFCDEVEKGLIKYPMKEH